jgi:hypothetical protein
LMYVWVIVEKSGKEDLKKKGYKHKIDHQGL